jgi:hypothetical protein
MTFERHADRGIAMVVPIQTVANVIEIIPMTEKASKQIQSSDVWKK